MSKKTDNDKNKSQVKGVRKHVKVKTARKRSNASTRWLERQLNDPYVAEAKRQGYRSRAAFKIIQMDEELGLFKKGQRVVDLGAAPGGWTQIAVSKVKPKETGGRVVALDYLDMEEIPESIFLKCDFMDDKAPDLLINALGGEADIVMSDMAAPTTGHKTTDHIRIISLVEVAYDFAKQVLAPDGIFLAKVFQGGTEGDLLNVLKKDFKKVKHIKPKSSRSDSAEMYVVGVGFRG